MPVIESATIDVSSVSIIPSIAKVKARISTVFVFAISRFGMIISGKELGITPIVATLKFK